MKGMKRLGSNKGFSLIEIIIVIALMGTLATFMIGNLGNLFSGGQQDAAKLWVDTTIKTPLMRYRIDIGSYPSTEEGLNALLKAPEGKEERWKGPYVEKMAKDPWSNPYQYRFPGVKNANGANGYDVWSWGPTGKESDDVIGNWEPEKKH